MCSAVHMWMSTVSSTAVTLNWQVDNLKMYEVLPYETDLLKIELWTWKCMSLKNC